MIPPGFRLNYSREIVRQINGWSCGAASCEIVLHGAGIEIPEAQLIHEIGTIPNQGTNHVSQIARVLNHYLPDANYQVAEYSEDPMPPHKREELWQQLVHSITRNHRGVVVNWWVPPNNRPRAAKDSTPLQYPHDQFIMHYVAAMGVCEEDRAVWIAEPGFPPYGGWVPFDGPGSVCSLVPPKGIAWSAA